MSRTPKGIFAPVARFIAAASKRIGTPTQAAAAAGISTMQLHRLITGKSTNPSVFIILRLAVASGLSIAVLQRDADRSVEAVCSTRCRSDKANLASRVEQLTTIAVALAECRARRHRVTRSELARKLRISEKGVSRLLAGKARPADLLDRGAIEEWLVARGECATCVAALSHQDFVVLLSQHVQPVTRAAKGSRVPKEPAQQ